MAVSIGEGPAERVKRYLVQELKDEYGSTVVHEDNAEHIGTFTNPEFTVQTGTTKHDSLGWASPTIDVFSIIQNADAETAQENLDNLRNDVVDKVREAVRKREPAISTVGPPWFDVTVTSSKIITKPENLRVEWAFEFKTGMTVGGI